MMDLTHVDEYSGYNAELADVARDKYFLMFCHVM